MEASTDEPEPFIGASVRKRPTKSLRWLLDTGSKSLVHGLCSQSPSLDAGPSEGKHHTNPTMPPHKTTGIAPTWVAVTVSQPARDSIKREEAVT